MNGPFIMDLVSFWGVSDWETMLLLVKPLVTFVISVRNNVFEHFRYFMEVLKKNNIFNLLTKKYKYYYCI